MNTFRKLFIILLFLGTKGIYAMQPITLDEVVNIFPRTVADIKELAHAVVLQARQELDTLLAIQPEERTYANTIKVLDILQGRSPLMVLFITLEVLEFVHPDQAIRQAAHDEFLKLQNFLVDHVSNSLELYQAIIAYTENRGRQETISSEERYFLGCLLEDFQRNGLHLGSAERMQIRELKKELAKLELDFQANISKENRTISLEKSDLEGLDKDFIESLKRTDDGRYLLGIDYPTYFAVMENCLVEETRKQMMRLFDNRAWPVNEELLRQIIKKRDMLAKIVGYPHYAAYDLSDQMVETVERAGRFISELSAKAAVKDAQEMEAVKVQLPRSVHLVGDKFKPWDLMYVKNQYKKTKFNIDEEKIAQYFPMEKTVDGLLGIYEQFFSLRFERHTAKNSWHDDVEIISVYSKEPQALLGYLFLDLYPRPNKYSHACHVTIIPSCYVHGSPNVALSVVITNFPKSTDQKPSLLKRSDVRTFFHEFGHALHAILGRTYIASFAGTHVKRDFVEMPSQMLEEWLTDKDILKKVSGHYQTGEPLPDELIDRIIAMKNFSAGDFLQRQLALSQFSLDLFKEGQEKVPQVYLREVYEQFKPHILFDPDNHMYASFGHLTGYGAKYYGYMWSKVFALDLFEAIKKEGLLNPVVGKKYVQEVIGKGGSEDPNVLLKNFLGREPNQEAFLRDLGLLV